MKNKFSICSSLLVLALTMLVSVSAQAQAYNPIRITGTVTAFSPADCGKPGSITIGGITLPIAAGAEVAFRDVMLTEGSLYGFPGQLVNGVANSEVWQVVGSVRALNAYLDPQGRIRLQIGTATSLTSLFTLFPVTSSARPFEITGIVSSISPVTINNTIIQTAAALPGVAAGPSIVRISGTLNASNQLTGGALVAPAYTTMSFPSLAPTDFRSVTAPNSTGLVSDVNAFDSDGPIAGVVFIYNPNGTAAGQFLCDQSAERITLEGRAALFFAPNFTMRNLISKDVATTFTFQVDQFGWIVGGTAIRP